MSVYAADLIRLALTQAGDRYVYGAEVSHSDPNPKAHHKPFDCSEFATTGERRLAELRDIARELEEEYFEPLDAKTRKALHEILLQLACHHDPRCAFRQDTA